MEKFPEQMKGLFGKPNFQLGIGDLARITGVSQSQLRYWESKNYITPIQDSIGKNRKYAMIEIGKALIIKKYLDEGFTLTAAVRKSIEHKEMMEISRKVAVDRFLGIEEIDGNSAINLGPLEDEPDKNVYAIVKDGHTSLRLISNK